MVSEKRSPIPAKAGRRERFDYEYQRNGTRNLFMTCEPLAGWRHVAVTGHRTMTDFAHLVSEKRSPIPAKAGRRERFDYEYQRNGTRNLFMTCEPLAGWRPHVAVTGHRTMTDFAQDALAGGCHLPGSGEGPGGAGQPEHS